MLSIQEKALATSVQATISPVCKNKKARNHQRKLLAFGLRSELVSRARALAVFIMRPQAGVKSAQ
jgi:hypothetical protein